MGTGEHLSPADALEALSPAKYTPKKPTPLADGLCSLCGLDTLVWPAHRVLGHNFGSWAAFQGTTPALCPRCAAGCKNKDLQRRPFVITPRGARFIDGAEVIGYLRSGVGVDMTVCVPSVGRKILYPSCMSWGGVVSDCWEGLKPWGANEATIVRIMCAFADGGMTPGQVEGSSLPLLPHATQSRSTLIDMWQWSQEARTKTLLPLWKKIIGYRRDMLKVTTRTKEIEQRGT